MDESRTDGSRRALAIAVGPWTKWILPPPHDIHMDARHRQSAAIRIALVFCACWLGIAGGCANWRIPRIDPTGERLLIWPHEQPAGGVAGPPVASVGPTASPTPPLFGVADQPPIAVEPQPATLPPQTNVDLETSLPGEEQGPPLWPDPSAPALFPSGLSGPSPFGTSTCPPAPAALTVAEAKPIDRVQISPRTLVAPIGSEVVVRAGVCASNGYLVTSQPVEWMLDPNGAGYLVDVGESPFVNALHRTRKVDNGYAVGRTASRQVVLDRGTPGSGDDVLIHKGESWISVSSSTEGSSRLTAVAKGVDSWPTRRASSTVHWVDAQWVFPESAVNAVGQSHVLSTRVLRLSDGQPTSGYIVRYSLENPELAGFAPDGAQVAEVATDATGNAAVELFPHEPRAGTANVRVEIIRPAREGPIPAPPLLLARSSVTKTWSAPNLQAQITGPGQGSVGAVLNYRILVSNQGNLLLNDVNVAVNLPVGMSFVQSNPMVQPTAGNLQWSFDNIEAGGARTILLDVRADQSGNTSICATARAADGQAAESCASTAIASALPVLDVQLEGPQQVNVGDVAEFVVTITNQGSATATNVTISDTFDQGLSHEGDTENRNKIERSLGDLLAGDSRTVYVIFDVVAAGELCHEVVAESDQGAQATRRACLTAMQPAEPPTPSFEVTRIAPAQAEVGQKQLFKIVIQNTGVLPLTNVLIEEQFDDALQPQRATEGARRVGNSLVWELPQLAASARIVYEVEYAMMRATVGGRNAQATVQVTADGEVRAEQSTIEILPRSGPPVDNGVSPPTQSARLSMEVSNTVDPVLVGRRTTLQVFINNIGMQSDFDVTVAITIGQEFSPDMQTLRTTLQAANLQAAFDENGVLTFSPVRELPAGETLRFAVPLDAVADGTGNIQINVTSRTHQQPLTTTQTATVLP